jgi:hypothetical protein
MRRVLRATGHAALVEAACALMRLPPFNAVAWQVFFGRGSFPDVKLETAPELAVSEVSRG